MKKPSRDRRAEACTRTHWRMRVGTRARGKRIGAQPRCAPLLRSYARQAIEAFERKLRPVGFAVTDLVTDAASSCKQREEGEREASGRGQHPPRLPCRRRRAAGAPPRAAVRTVWRQWCCSGRWPAPQTRRAQRQVRPDMTLHARRAAPAPPTLWAHAARTRPSRSAGNHLSTRGPGSGGDR